MIVLDASVLIAHLDDQDPHHEAARSILLEVAEEPFGASSLTLAEVLVGPAAAGKLDDVRKALRDLDVSEIRLGDDSPTRLATLRADTGLKLPDCCVLLAAQDAAAEAVATLDKRLAAKAKDLGFDVAIEGKAQDPDRPR